MGSKRAKGRVRGVNDRFAWHLSRSLLLAGENASKGLLLLGITEVWFKQGSQHVKSTSPDLRTSNTNPSSSEGMTAVATPWFGHLCRAITFVISRSLERTPLVVVFSKLDDTTKQVLSLVMNMLRLSSSSECRTPQLHNESYSGSSSLH